MIFPAGLKSAWINSIPNLASTVFHNRPTYFLDFSRNSVIFVYELAKHMLLCWYQLASKGLGLLVHIPNLGSMVFHSRPMQCENDLSWFFSSNHMVSLLLINLLLSWCQNNPFGLNMAWINSIPDLASMVFHSRPMQCENDEDVSGGNIHLQASFLPIYWCMMP